MPVVEYSSDDDGFTRRTTPRGDSSSDSDWRPTQSRLNKAAHNATARASNTMHDSESFVEQHKTQIAVAAAVAGGLAVASFVVRKVLGNKRSQASRAEKGKGAAAAAAHRASASQPKKVAVRRKRSG